MIKTRIIREQYIFEIFLSSRDSVQLVCVSIDRMNELHDIFINKMEKLITEDYL